MHQYIAEKKGGHLDSYLSMQSRINDKRSNYFMPKLNYNDLIQRYIGLKTLDKKIEFKKYCWNWIFQKWILKTDGIWTRRAQCACLFIQESPKILTSTDLQHGFGRPPHFFSCQPTFPYLKTCTGTQISKQNHCKQLTLILISFLKCSSRFLAHCLRQRFKTLLNGFNLIFKEFCLFVILYQP